MIILVLDYSYSGSNGGEVVRALDSDQCGPGLYPSVDTTRGLSLLLVVSLALWGFSPALRFSPLLKNQHFQTPIRSGTNGHVSTSSYELLRAPWVNKQQITICSKFTITMKTCVSSLPTFYKIISSSWEAKGRMWFRSTFTGWPVLYQ